MLPLFNSFSRFYRAIPRLGRLAIFGILGAGISLFLWVNQSHAASTVLLQFRDLKQPIPLTELQAFAMGEDPSPTLEQFLKDTNQNTAEVKGWLTTEIKPHELTPLIATNFVLLQVNKTIGDPLGRENLDPLKEALDKSFGDDNSFSILEILDEYPNSEVRLEVSRLGQAFRDINLWVSRISPVIGVAEKLLPELLCPCNTPDLSNGASTKQAIAYDQVHTSLKALRTEEETAEVTLDPALRAAAPSNSPTLDDRRLVIQFGLLAPSISLRDLTYFAETGELSSAWRFMLGIAKINPADLRSALQQEVSVKLSSLDRLLNNLLGEFLLFQVGQIVQTPSNTANIQALRAASILSVADDNKLSLIEVLQQYPTQNVILNGTRLARLGHTASRFKAQGGIQGAALSVEDWLVQLQSSATETVCKCAPGTTQATSYPSSMVPPTIAPEQIAQFLPANWQPVEPHREDHGVIKVVWLKGSPYDMGYQHGQYLHDEIASLGSTTLEALRFAGKGLALGKLAARRSFPNIVEECRGLSDATQDIGMTLDACLVLSYGDVFQEVFGATLPEVLFWEGCSQWVAMGDATVDGRLYHGSTVDNDKKPVNYIVKNPVMFIRQPVDGLPHVFITYPGVLWPNWGLNVAGITVGLDTLHPNGPDELSFDGGSNVQIMAKVLKTATSFAEARNIMETQPRVRANLIMITDGKSKEAGVFEFTGKHLGVREMPESGVLYMTNHSILEDMEPRQRQPLSSSSLLRFQRFGQLMEPDGVSSLYGSIDPAAMARIGRDRINPKTMQASPLDLFDDNASPGGNGSLRQAIYDPDKLLLWIAGGPPPVPENPFVCFSLGEMLNFPNAAPCEAPSL